MIDGKNFFDRPVKNGIRTYNNIRKISTGQGDYYTTGCLLHYNYFKEHYKMIVIDLSKQQELDYENQSVIFFIIEEAKETVLDFLERTVKVL